MPRWSPLGVKFKIFDEHPRLFHMGVHPPGTKQLIDNNIAIKMLSLMRIKKLHGVIFAVVAVYLQRKTA